MYNIGIKLGDYNQIVSGEKSRVIFPIFFLALLSIMAYRTVKVVPPTEGNLIEKVVYMIREATETMMKLRIMVTIFLIFWLAVMTYYMAFRYDKESIFDFWKTDEEKVVEKQPIKPEEGEQALGLAEQTINFRKTDKPTRLYYLHKIWFGDESIVYILFKIWFMTIMFFIALPIIKEILLNLNLDLETVGKM